MEPTPAANSANLPQEAPAAITVDLQVLHVMLAAVKEDEEKEVLRHAESMALLATRRIKYSTTLSVLAEIYPSVGTAESETIENRKQPADLPPAPDHEPLDTNKNKKPEPDRAHVKASVPRKREKHGVLKRALLSIFKQHDTFLTTEDFKKAFQASSALKGYTNKRITDGLKDARRPGQGVIGIQAYSGAFPKFVNGLADFFEDAEGKRPKPEYAEKLRVRLGELGLTLEKQVAGQAKHGSLFQS